MSQTFTKAFFFVMFVSCHLFSTLRPRHLDLWSRCICWNIAGVRHTSTGLVSIPQLQPLQVRSRPTTIHAEPRWSWEPWVVCIYKVMWTGTLDKIPIWLMCACIYARLNHILYMCICKHACTCLSQPCHSLFHESEMLALDKRLISF